MLDVAWRHQDAGRPVYIVTAASQEIAELLAHVLVFDGGIGARSEIRDGVYTGRRTVRSLQGGQGGSDPPGRRREGIDWPSRTRTRTQSRIYDASAP